MGILGLPLGSPRTKSHLDVAPVKSCRIYYKGEGGSFPQVWAMVSLVCPSCPWLVLTPKVFELCTNHPVLVLCRFVWIIKACQFFLVPSHSSSTPLYPFKLLWAMECVPTPSFSIVFSLGLTFESFKELGAHHLASLHQQKSCPWGRLAHFCVFFHPQHHEWVGQVAHSDDICQEVNQNLHYFLLL